MTARHPGDGPRPGERGALRIATLLVGRAEAGVGNEGFLKSMIPHHSRAVLVCQESDVTDPEIEELCPGIVETRKQEIARMQAILERCA